MDEAGGGQSGYGDAKSDSFPQATTRVLTDEKGHSIKIRLASPPPQRQAALAKLHEKARHQQQQQQQQQELSCVVRLSPVGEELKQRTKEEELPSISGAISARYLAADGQESSSGNEQKQQQAPQTTLKRYLKSPEPNRVYSTTRQSDNFREVCARERSSEKSRGVSKSGDKNVEVASCGRQFEESHGKDSRLVRRDQSSHRLVTRSARSRSSSSSSSTSESTLIDTCSTSLGTSPDSDRCDINTCHESSQTTAGYSNDEITSTTTTTTTSEVDIQARDCDSRRDTSLDYNQANFWQQQREQLLNSSLSDNLELGNNDMVMDADLRCANRLNLELLMMQNTALHNMMGLSPASNRRSIFGPGFPQSGVLPAASEQVAALQQVASQTGDQAASYEELIAALQRQLSASNSSTPQLDNNNTIGLHKNSSSGESSNAMDNILGESRRSSSDMSHSFTPFGNVPSLRILVKPLKTNPREQTQEQNTSSSSVDNTGREKENNGKRSILDRLWSFESLKNSASTIDGDQVSGKEKAPTNVEEFFEVHLLEVRNLMPRCRQVSNDSAPLQASNNARRNSAEGLFVRVFKRQGKEMLVVPSMESSNQSRQQVNNNQMMLSTRVSSSENEQHQIQDNPLHGADFIQLPLVKTSFQEDKINLAKLSKAYKFICASSEFPLRISLYQMSKKANARYTLGHCLVSANCWSMFQEDRKREQDRDRDDDSHKRLSSSSILSETRSSASSEPKFVILPGSDINNALEEIEDDKSEDGAERRRRSENRVLEYRLFQTILEAV